MVILQSCNLFTYLFHNESFGHWYSSIHIYQRPTRLLYTQSHCNDLESLAYTIIYSALGNLPWSSNSAGNHEKAILQKKTSIMAEELCKGLPAPFCKFITYVHSLGFDQKPDYQYLHSILLQCLEAETNQPIKVPPLYLCQVSIDREPISTGRA